MSSKNLSAREVQGFVLGLLLITSGGLVIGSGSPGNGSPPLNINGIQTCQTFFFAFSGTGSGPMAVTPGTAAPSMPVSTQTNPAPQSQAGEDFMYVRQGNTYAIFPQSPEESMQYLLLAQMPQLWSDSRHKRSRFRTHVEILDLLKGGPLSTFEVAFQLRLNSKRTRDYLEFLEQQELVERGLEEKALYNTTPKGMVFVERARALLFLDN